MRPRYGTFSTGIQRRTLLRLGAGAVAALALVPAMAAARPLKLVVLGDSLSAGYGLAATEAFPARLSRALARKGLNVEVINAGVSGDTATGGRDRLDWSVPEGVDAVIVELGANDALRGIDPAVTRQALDDIIKRLKVRNIPILLAGMMAPRNIGADYARRFDAIYPDLATAHGVALYPFFLDGVATVPALNQRDGIHPTAAGVDEIVTRIMPYVERLLAQVTAG